MKFHETMNEKIYNLITSIETQGKENAFHIKVINDDSIKIAAEQEKIKEELATWREHNAVKLANIETDVQWIKKLQWFVITTSIGGLIGTITMLLSFIFK